MYSVREVIGKIKPSKEINKLQPGIRNLMLSNDVGSCEVGLILVGFLL